MNRKKISFLGKVIAMLKDIRIGNHRLFITFDPFKGYGIGSYKRAVIINIWKFSILIIFDDKYFIA